MGSAMHEIRRRLWRWVRRESGQTMAEYAFILAAIAVVAFAAFQLFGIDVQAPINATRDTFP